MLARIFASFRLTGAAAGTATVAALRYMRWMDPKEGAFSLEVPAGWAVSGGLARYAAVDTRVGITILSPDKNVSLLIGDSTIGTFIVPNQLLQIGGFSEGSSYSPGYGVTMTVLHYIPGVDFASRYADELAKLDPRAQPVLGDPLVLKELAITGNDLMQAGHPAGRALGELLTSLLDRVLHDPSLNTRDQLLALAKG